MFHYFQLYQQMMEMLQIRTLIVYHILMLHFNWILDPVVIF